MSQPATKLDLDRVDTPLKERPWAGSSVLEDYENNPDRFFNDRDPQVTLQKEKPEHRIVVLLKLQSYSNREISKLTGYSTIHIGTILRQPWAKAMMVAELKKAGREEVQAILQASMVDSVFRVMELAECAEDEGVRLRANQDLLDRHLGKATLRVESTSTVKHLGSTVSEVDAELEKVQAELARLTGGPTNERSEQLLAGPTPSPG